MTMILFTSIRCYGWHCHCFFFRPSFYVLIWYLCFIFHRANLNSKHLLPNEENRETITRRAFLVLVAHRIVFWGACWRLLPGNPRDTSCSFPYMLTLQEIVGIATYLDFHSTKRALWLVDSWSRASDQIQMYPDLDTIAQLLPAPSLFVRFCYNCLRESLNL